MAAAFLAGAFFAAAFFAGAFFAAAFLAGAFLVTAMLGASSAGWISPSEAAPPWRTVAEGSDGSLGPTPGIARSIPRRGVSKAVTTKVRSSPTVSTSRAFVGGGTAIAFSGM